MRQLIRLMMSSSQSALAFLKVIVRKTFFGFHKSVSAVTGEAIRSFRHLTAVKYVHGQLEPQLLRGQAYNGAGAMAGKTKGAIDTYFTESQGSLRILSVLHIA